jgi:ribosomal protein L16 Arg81 hydroxylase
MWIGNRAMIAAHFDNNYNIACVVSGRRRFTVFPPEQVSNLYIGPLLRTPGGSPISTVDLRDPDYTKYPKFAQALESAEEAELEPGDAIYIPILWWHGVIRNSSQADPQPGALYDLDVRSSCRAARSLARVF